MVKQRNSRGILLTSNLPQLQNLIKVCGGSTTTVGSADVDLTFSEILKGTRRSSYPSTTIISRFSACTPSRPLQYRTKRRTSSSKASSPLSVKSLNVIRPRRKIYRNS